ncbi:Uncharacterised protein [Mycobacterium tuberculosis]|nr:Uncharacterised protein [Mycobacterium tuberculosis]
MVSAALVTVRSSGSLVGGLEELRLICTGSAHRAEVLAQHHLDQLADPGHPLDL